MSAAEPQQADVSTLLDLVHQHGEERRQQGYTQANPADGADVVRQHRKAARALFAHIAELVPPYEQARDGENPLWIHPCGSVLPFRVPPNGEAHHVYPPCPKPGPWRPLLVGGTRAPERQTDADVTPEKQCLREDAHGGHLWQGGTVDFWCDGFVGRAGVPQPDLIAQVMAELGVHRPEDVLGAIKLIQNNRDHWLGEVKRQRQIRDAARAELSLTQEALIKTRADRDRIVAASDHLMGQLRTQLARYTDDHGSPLPTDAELDVRIGEVTRERDEARAEVERLKVERDAWIEQARQAGVKLEQLKAAAPQHDGPLVLSLPEVPEGAVALVGVESGTRYAPGKAIADEGCWYSEKTFTWHEHLGEVLAIESGGVRVEMAPPREPRTAAEIWAGLSDGMKADVARHGGGELAEALDREAGTS